MEVAKKADAATQALAQRAAAKAWKAAEDENKMSKV